MNTEPNQDMDVYKKLHGDDDGGVYFKDKHGGEWYLHGYTDLIKQIIELCEKFFEEHVEKQ